MKSNRRRGCGKSTGGKFAFPPTLCVSLSQQMFSGVFDRRLKLCGMVHGSQCQVAESKQAVVGVLDIQLIVSPVTVETTFSAPEAVDKIKTRFPDWLEGRLQGIQSVEGDGRGEQVRHWRFWKSEECTACRMLSG